MEMREVYSSSVDRIGYDAETQELHVVWRRGGKTSVYQDVPPDKAQQVMNAWSVGQAVRELHGTGDHGHAYR